MDGFTVSETIPLRSPVVVVAFTGWSDTGTVTVDAARRLIDAYGARSFLVVDPEPYYVFTDTRPTVKLDEQGQRSISWPVNEAFYAPLPDAPHDLVVVSGVEPNLKWKTFIKHLADAITRFEPSIVCTLTARPAATPHTRPIPVGGSAADPAIAAKYGLGRSLYQGPTGLVGVLHDALRQRDIPLMSLSASVPHYLNVEENPPATAALLKALEPIIGLPPPLDGLDDEGERFLQRVEEASRGDDQIGSYVRSLEENYQEPGEALAEDTQLPSADDILRDVEDLLRGGNGD